MLEIMADDFIMRNKIDTCFKPCDFETDQGFDFKLNIIIKKYIT